MKRSIKDENPLLKIKNSNPGSFHWRELPQLRSYFREVKYMRDNVIWFYDTHQIRRLHENNPTGSAIAIDF
uniref:Uncharacterized protein n=1 Tax=Metallosphaera hakonensis JCM 8857 = DSM 7519 TaxID=1293036 RepID=A0A2U9IR94_9CREN